MRWNPFRNIAVQILLLAAGMVVLRIALFDHQILSLEIPPNHDMLEGNAWFSPNMHSLREFGDLAWWMPETNNGYPQYYQSFLSPEGPTPGYLPFLCWAGCMQGLQAFGIVVPEYVQYVVLTYVVTSFLMFCALGYFAYELFRNMRVVGFALTIFTLSSTGTWHSAFMYFQETATLFFLLASLLTLLRKPYGRSYFVFALALVIQVAGTNFWTIYNVPFYAIFLGAHALVYRALWRRLLVRTRSLWRRNPRVMTAASAGMVLVLLAWLALLASIFAEQARAHTRTTAAQGYDSSSMMKYPVRQFTLGFILPGVPEKDAVHQGRYLGAELIPLLCLVPLLRLRRQRLFLLLVAGGVFFLCLGPGWFAKIWMSLPVLKNIRHVFYMYTQYLQFTTVLLACSALSSILRIPLSTTARSWFFVLASVSVAGSVVLWFLKASDVYPQLFLLPAVTLGATVAIGLIVSSKHRWMNLGYATLMLLTVADLGRYFRATSTQDISTSAKRWKEELVIPIPPETVRTLREPWPAMTNAQGFHAGLFAYQPMNHYIWPVNNYLQPTPVYEAREHSKKAQRYLFEGIPVQWIEGKRIANESKQKLEEAIAEKSVIFADHTAINDIVPELNPKTEWKLWSYNAFEFQVDAPRQGYLLLRQVYDPLWQFTIDGVTAKAEPADQVLTALAIEPGKHLIRIEYRPLARRLYPIAVILLILFSIVMIIGAWKASSLRPRRITSA